MHLRNRGEALGQEGVDLGLALEPPAPRLVTPGQQKYAVFGEVAHHGGHVVAVEGFSDLVDELKRDCLLGVHSHDPVLPFNSAYLGLTLACRVNKRSPCHPLHMPRLLYHRSLARLVYSLDYSTVTYVSS